MLAASLLFLLTYIGIGISLWPTIAPYRVTLLEAASSPSTQAFLLVGAPFLAAGNLDVYGLVVLGISRQSPK
jgi:cytochrome bd-type quinol oxidase subunit 2